MSSVFSEKPEKGGWWRVGAEFHERQRCRLLDNAGAAERVGNTAGAARYREIAESHRQDRDRKQAAAVLAEFKRRAFRRAQ